MLVESRVARVLFSHPRLYSFGSNTFYDEAQLNYIFQAEVLRPISNLTFNCLYSSKIEIYNNNIKTLTEKGVLYNVKMFLKNDEYIFNDLVDIINLTIGKFISG